MHGPHLDFALALHHQLPGAGNLPWSPYSVASALGAAAAGARGRTGEELARTLAPGSDLDELGRILAGSAALPDGDLAVANTLWTRAGWRILEDYQQAVHGWPGGALRTADFAGDPDGARTEINEDVAYTTRDLIRDLLPEGAVHPLTAAVLVNALYLKVAWVHAFAEAETVPAPFRAPSGTREVPTMRQQESLRYAAAGGWRMVTLPAAGGVVVDLLLPDDGEPATGVPATDVLAALDDAARPAKVDLTVPRFRVEAAVTLNDHLRRLGVRHAFDSDLANFSGITDTGRIWVDQVVHKTVVRVDEQGFEGAAATAVVMRTVSVDLSAPVPFHVDRPFLMLVRHRRTSAVYFLARVAEP